MPKYAQEALSNENQEIIKTKDLMNIKRINKDAS